MKDFSNSNFFQENLYLGDLLLHFFGFSNRNDFLKVFKRQCLFELLRLTSGIENILIYLCQ